LALNDVIGVVKLDINNSSLLFQLICEFDLPCFGSDLLSSFNIITVSVREIIEAICFVEARLDLLVSLSLFNTELDVLSVLCLLCNFLLDLDLSELVKLFLDALVFKALFLQLVHLLLCLFLSSSS